MSYFFDLPNEILDLILSNLDPFKDFQNLVSIPQLKLLINNSICVLTDDLRIKKQSPLVVSHLATYQEIIHHYRYFIINICAPVGEVFLPKIINSMVLFKRPHIIDFQTELLPRGFFNQSIFNGNEYTKGIYIANSNELGSSTIFEKFYDTINFTVEAPNLKFLHADFGNRKSFLEKFELPNLNHLEVKSSHLSSNCIRKFGNLTRLSINSFSDLEDLSLNHLKEINLSAGYSLMLSNCKFPKLVKIQVDPNARLPGIINCELDCLEELDVESTKTSYIKDLYAPKLTKLNLVHTMRGILNTLVFSGGSFPSLESLILPSPVYFGEFELSNSLENIESLTVYVQKQWFYPTIPMYLMKDDDTEEHDLSMGTEFDLLFKSRMNNLKNLTIIVENLSKSENSILRIPDLMKPMPQLERLKFEVSVDDLYFDVTQYDLSFLKFRTLDHFYTNIKAFAFVEFEKYRLNHFHFLNWAKGHEPHHIYNAETRNFWPLT